MRVSLVGCRNGLTLRCLSANWISAVIFACDETRRGVTTTSAGSTSDSPRARADSCGAVADGIAPSEGESQAQVGQSCVAWPWIDHSQHTSSTHLASHPPTWIKLKSSSESLPGKAPLGRHVRPRRRRPCSDPGGPPGCSQVSAYLQAAMMRVLTRFPPPERV